jgi:MoaA/NifB/PqqE/SkfB family radical SAM enzyme
MSRPAAIAQPHAQARSKPGRAPARQLVERAVTSVAKWALGYAPLPFFKRLPPILIVESTNLCNLRCPVCPVTLGIERPRGMMPIETFRKIVDDMDGLRRKPAIYFNFSGEPTLCRALPEFIAYATAHGHESFVSTNATKIDRALATALIEAGLTRINLCLDGFSPEAHEAYRVRSSFHEVKANIELFAAVRRELGATKPQLVLQTLLTSRSEPQVDQIVEWAGSIGLDKVRFKTFSLGSHTSEELRARFRDMLPTRREWRRHRTETERKFCSIPLKQGLVFWNGDIGLCCIDYNQMVQLPNANELGFLAAYRSDAAARARRNALVKRFGVCRSCSYSNAENMGFVVKLKRWRASRQPPSGADTAA